MIRRSIGFLFVFAFSVHSFASPTNRGYSGAPGSLGRCSSSCHGVNGGTVQVTGFPTEYVPDSTYLLTIQAVSGSPIKNFNGSVRVGTGSVTAGQITPGFNTTTYSIAQENNGVRLSVLDRQSANFNWRAPAAGTGTVRLYVAAHQGPRDSGPNTNLTIVSTEAVIPQAPNAPTNPTPIDGAINVSLPLVLGWSAVSEAESYEVFLGTAEPLGTLGTVEANSFPLTTQLSPNTVYLWRVDASNAAGTTEGFLWSFTTESQSAAHDIPAVSSFLLSDAYPNPFNGLVRLNLTLPQTGMALAKVYDINGRETATLVNGSLGAGAHVLEWNAAGSSAGLYFLRLQVNGISENRKLVYLP